MTGEVAGSKIGVLIKLVLEVEAERTGGLSIRCVELSRRRQLARRTGYPERWAWTGYP